jgi:hypothetical protein
LASPAYDIQQRLTLGRATSNSRLALLKSLPALLGVPGLDQPACLLELAGHAGKVGRQHFRQRVAARANPRAFDGPPGVDRLADRALGGVRGLDGPL